MSEARRGRRHPDRHGRRPRGPLCRPSPYAPQGLPLHHTSSRRFDAVVAREVSALEKHLPQLVSRVEFAIADVPPIGPTDTEVPLIRREGGQRGDPYRLVVFRRPIEMRARPDNSDGEADGSSDELSWLVHEVLVQELADVLGMSPEAVDPDPRDDD